MYSFFGFEKQIRRGGGQFEKDKRISNELDVSDSDEEEDGDGEKKRNNQSYKKRASEQPKTAETNGIHKSDTEAKIPKLDEASEAKSDVKA